jgi:hypothetical protein
MKATNFVVTKWPISGVSQFICQVLQIFYFVKNVSPYHVSRKINTSKFFDIVNYAIRDNNGDRGGTVVKVLCYKSEGRWFDPNRCHWKFSLI